MNAPETTLPSTNGAGPRPASKRPPRVATAVPLNILVVEDDDAEREAIVGAVQALGHRCRSARDGLQAWEIHQRDHADIILSDWQMPRMDGFELCERTRVASDDSAYTYFIFMTNFSDKEHFVRGMAAGADDYFTKPVDLDELEARLVSAGRVVAVYRKLAMQNAVLRRDSQTLFRAAHIDRLTQVANRLAMDEDLTGLWARVKRYGNRYSIAIGDIDQFKAYNDHFGHIAGDEVLRRVACAIREGLREGDGLYRYGGEEFVVVLPEQSLAEAERAMDRVCHAVERLAIPTTKRRVITLSCGVAELDASTDASPQDALHRADAALYRAKAEGRNRVETDRPMRSTTPPSADVSSSSTTPPSADVPSSSTTPPSADVSSSSTTPPSADVPSGSAGA